MVCVVVRRLNAWNHLAFINFIFIFISFLSFSLFLLMLLLIMQSLLFLLLFCSSLLRLLSRCVHVYTKTQNTIIHTNISHTYISQYVCLYVFCWFAVASLCGFLNQIRCSLPCHFCLLGFIYINSIVLAFIIYLKLLLLLLCCWVIDPLIAHDLRLLLSHRHTLTHKMHARTHAHANAYERDAVHKINSILLFTLTRKFIKLQARLYLLTCKFTESKALLYLLRLWL